MPTRIRLFSILCALLVMASSAAFIGCNSGSGTTTLKPVAPSISTQPAAQSAFVGDTVTFNVAATGNPAPTYQWQKAASAISGATNSSYTTPNLTAADDGSLFTVIVSNSAGSVTSSSAKLSVSVKPAAITTQPANITIADGASATFSVVAMGTAPIAYQWSKNRAPVSGATTSSYTFGPATIADSGTLFSVTVSNSAATVTSTAAKVTVTAAAPTITKQPSDATQFIGEQATFSVAADGTSPSYQWLKNSKNISGAKGPFYTTPILIASDDKDIYSVTVTNSAGSVPSAPATLHVGPFATSYTTQKGKILNQYAWPGRSYAVLTKLSNLDPVSMRKILKAADDTWNYYDSATGQLPSVYFNYNGLATIADTGVGGIDLCGDGCTFIGATGMEISDNAWAALYDGVSNNVYDQVIFYETGRSFWVMGSQLQYPSPADSSCQVTGFAVFMRYRSLDALGLQGSFGTVANYETYYNYMQTMIDAYAADTSLNFNNTFLANSYSSPYGGCADLWSSMMYRLAKNYGGEAFVKDVFKEALKRPVAVTTQDAVDNFVLSASAAANANLTLTFGTTWRWPISDAAKQEAQDKWGNPQ